jgi:hypothetical protein
MPKAYGCEYIFRQCSGPCGRMLKFAYRSGPRTRRTAPKWASGCQNTCSFFETFAGIFSVPHVAIQMCRQGWGTELSEEYWRCGVGYCEQADTEANSPTLFDFDTSNLAAKHGISLQTGKRKSNPVI